MGALDEIMEIRKEFPWWMRTRFFEEKSLQDVERTVMLSFLVLPFVFVPLILLLPGMRRILVPLAILSYTLPVGFIVGRMERFKESVERNFISFLRSLGENIKAGMSLVEALKLASEGDFGHLTPFIRYIVSTSKWGVDMFTTLDELGRKVSSQHIRRAVMVIKSGFLSGGDFSDVLLNAAGDMAESLDLREKLKTRSSSYSAIGYMSFAIYLFAIAVILAYFIPQIVGQTHGGTGAFITRFALHMHGTSGHHSKINVSELKDALYWGTLVQAIGIGAVSGMLSRGKISSSLLYASFLLIGGVVAFMFLGLF